MGKIIQELLALKYTPWYRWHPQLALRYLPVVEEIKKQETMSKKQWQILEVGSGGLGIAPYLKRKMTGVDVKFGFPIHPLLAPIVGDVTCLKFERNSFDVVVSMDMLEHLPRGKRQKAISEMIRVAKKKVMIGVPCGRTSSEQDVLLRQTYMQGRKKEYAFLKEQVEYGLPEKEEILQYIANSDKDDRKVLRVDTIGNENLRLRLFFMNRWMSSNILINIIFRKAMLLFIPALRMLDKSPYYRQIFFITMKKNKKQ